MHWLLIGYMFLFIDRPFEVWPWLGDLRIERIYMLITIAVWAFNPNKRWLGNVQHVAYAAFAFAVLVCWVLSPWSGITQPKIEDWFKIVVFYVLLVTSVNDEDGLQKLIVGFLCVMSLYLLHSFKEYAAGKHVYRMGIARMVGVDNTLGDPNSFGASLVFALPMVSAVWRSGIGGRKGKFALLGYTGLTALAILLTGSRSSLLGFLVWSALVILGDRRRFLWLTLFALAAPIAFVALPDSLQNRFETIINPDVGPENAKVSGEGRVQGLLMGFELWSEYPLNGVGPGAWIPATGSEIESHNLIGQLVGEMGLFGLISFLGILASFVWNAHKVRAVRKAYPEWSGSLVSQVPRAVMTTVFLLLFMGFFGHNLFRFTWLWFGGFLVIARFCLQQRVQQMEELAEYESATITVDDDGEVMAETEDWQWHAAGQ